MNATYFQFRNERKKDIENLWKFFESVINYLKDPSIENIEEFSKLFNIAINLKNNGTSKITMALYWISPESFLNLDNRSIWFIYESGKIPKEVINKLPKIETKITAETYLTIIAEIKLYLDSENSKLNNFKDLSYDAYIYSEEVNLQIKEDKIKKEDGLAGQNEEVYHERIQNCEINRKA